MTNVFAVVGEHRREPGRLLLLGEDGRFYAYRADGAPMEVEPGAAWLLDEAALQAATRPQLPAPKPTSPGPAAPEREPAKQRLNR